MHHTAPRILMLVALASAACTSSERPASATRASDTTPRAGATVPRATDTATAPSAPGDTAALGTWTQPVPGMPGEMQGFALLPGGHARSVNMASLRHDVWRREGDTIVVTGASIGNRSVSVERMRFVRRDSGGTAILASADGQRYRRSSTEVPAPQCHARSDAGGRTEAVFFLDDSTVTGRLTYERAMKDGNDGTVEARIGADGVIAGTYHFYSEGLLSQRDIAFRPDRGALVEASDPMVMRGGRQVYVDGAPRRFAGERLESSPCR